MIIHHDQVGFNPKNEKRVQNQKNLLTSSETCNKIKEKKHIKLYRCSKKSICGN